MFSLDALPDELLATVHAFVHDTSLIQLLGTASTRLLSLNKNRERSPEPQVVRNWCKQVSARDGSSRSTSLFVLSVTVQPVSGFHRESTPSEHENRAESFQVDHCSQMFSSVNAVMRSLTSIRAAMVGVFRCTRTSTGEFWQEADTNAGRLAGTTAGLRGRPIPEI